MDVKLVNVVQVMLVRLVLPCQHQTCNLWEYDPTEHQTLWELYGSSHKDIWKVLFKSGKSWLDSAEDHEYQLSRPASSVSHCMLPIHTFYSHNPREMLDVFSTTLLGLDEEGGADLLRPHCHKNRLAHFSRRCWSQRLTRRRRKRPRRRPKRPGRPPSPRHFGHNIRRL